MLSGRLTLHDVRDVEALCGRVISRSGIELDHHDREELLAFLVEHAWFISRHFVPNGIRFTTFATTQMQKQIHEWKRRRHGRTRWKSGDRIYERRIPAFVSMDADRSGLEQALGGVEVDGTEPGAEDLARMLAD